MIASPQELAGLAPGASPRCIGCSRPLCIATVHRSQSQFASPAPFFVASRTGAAYPAMLRYINKPLPRLQPGSICQNLGPPATRRRRERQEAHLAVGAPVRRDDARARGAAVDDAEPRAGADVGLALPL